MIFEYIIIDINKLLVNYSLQVPRKRKIKGNADVYNL